MKRKRLLMSPITEFVIALIGLGLGIFITFLPWIMDWESSDTGNVLYFTICAVTIIAFLLAFVGQFRYAILEGDVITAIRILPFRKRVYRVEEIQRIFIYNHAATARGTSYMDWIRIELEGRDKKGNINAVEIVAYKKSVAVVKEFIFRNKLEDKTQLFEEINNPFWKGE